jgi:hypothetical protein
MLIKEIPDLNDEMVDAIGTWVEGQPDFLQNAYKDVITQGSVPQLKAVVDRFKAETGWQPKVQQDPVPAPAARQNAELPAAAKQAAASLAPVSGKRSAVPQGEDKGDFAASFARFASLDQL